MADGAPADRAPSLVHPVAPDQSHLDAATATFRMLSDPTRLHILWLLAQTEADVSALTEACGASRTAVSQHLAKLRFTGLVATPREGRRVVKPHSHRENARQVRGGQKPPPPQVTGGPTPRRTPPLTSTG
ncbi:ArsR/SmtB family transcription factor, partial [Nocardia wallacei]|uniref:ArsR/SmtB family transcription factor n=1 Tax=Nocardia wallacei TaxID=480035 RepID=UPI003CC7FA74